MVRCFLVMMGVSFAVACSSADGSPDGGPTPDGAVSNPDAAPSADGAIDAAPSTDAGEGGIVVPPTTGVQSSPTFGFTVNTTSKYPSVSYGTQRIWDSPPFQWATLETAECPDVSACSGAYDMNNMASFDGYLAKLKTNGVGEVWYTMARTPNFISSSPTDAKCSYTEAGQGGLGQCDRPSDLAADGTGTNITFRKWYAFFAKRNNDPTYLSTHAHIRYWEPWNEPDTAKFWGDGNGGLGTFDALVRLMQDTECLIVGDVGTGKITKTGETCAEVQSSVGLSGPIDPTAIVVSPSYHAKQASLSLYRNFLYCDSSPQTSCTSGDAGAKSLMAFNLHMKPGQECVVDGAQTNCTTATSVEPAYEGYIKSFEATLQSAELAAFQAGTLPLFDGEASYSPTSFLAPFTDEDMAASFITRFFLYGRSLGVMGNQWYTWDAIEGMSKVTTAWNTLYDAWVGTTGSTTPLCTSSGTVYTCSFAKGSASYEVLWDISQSCANGSCTTQSQSVGAQWSSYRDLTGTASSCVTACPIASHAVPVGIKPVILSM